MQGMHLVLISGMLLLKCLPEPVYVLLKLSTEYFFLVCIFLHSLSSIHIGSVAFARIRDSTSFLCSVIRVASDVCLLFVQIQALTVPAASA